MKTARMWPWMLVVCAVVMTAALWMTGWLSGSTMPDTASYLDPQRWPVLWGQTRSPLCGFLVLPFGTPLPALPAVAGAQLVLHVLACGSLYGGARAAGLRPDTAFCLALAALLSQTFLLWGRVAIPESPAVSLLLIGFALTLAASRSPSILAWCVVPIGFALGAAYTLRPTFLPAVLALPALWLLLARRRGARRLVPCTALLIVASLVPFVAQSAVRKLTVAWPA